MAPLNANLTYPDPNPTGNSNLLLTQILTIIHKIHQTTETSPHFNDMLQCTIAHACVSGLRLAYTSPVMCLMSKLCTQPSCVQSLRTYKSHVCLPDTQLCPNKKPETPMLILIFIRCTTVNWYMPQNSFSQTT